MRNLRPVNGPVSDLTVVLVVGVPKVEVVGEPGQLLVQATDASVVSEEAHGDVVSIVRKMEPEGWLRLEVGGRVHLMLGRRMHAAEVRVGRGLREGGRRH